MNCPSCGAENAQNAKYCSLCLKPFQTPAEIELAQEVAEKKETKKAASSGANSNILVKLIILMSVTIVVLSVVYVGLNAVRKSVSNDVMNLAGVSTSEGGGIKVKRMMGDRMVEAFVGKVPEGFPTDIAAYKGAKVKIGQRITEQNANMVYTVIWESKASVKNIMDYYKTVLTQNYYKITTPTNEGFEESGLMEFSKAHATGKLTVNSKGDQSNIFITLTFNND